MPELCSKDFPLPSSAFPQEAEQSQLPRPGPFVRTTWPWPVQLWHRTRDVDVHRWLSLGSALADTRRCSEELPAACLLLPAQQTHKASTASQLTRPLSFTHPQNLLCKRNKVTGSRNNNPQERSCGKEVNQLCFVPPCPQLCDRNLSSATGVSFAELGPVFPLPDLGFLNPDQPLLQHKQPQEPPPHSAPLARLHKGCG